MTSPAGPPPPKRTVICRSMGENGGIRPIVPEVSTCFNTRGLSTLAMFSASQPLMPGPREATTAEQHIMHSQNLHGLVNVEMGNFDSLLVDQALKSLPQVLSQVTTKYKDHVAELEKQKEILKEKQTRLSEEMRKLDEMREEVRGVERKIYLCEDSTSQVRSNCQHFQAELEKMLKITNELKFKVTEKENEIEKVRRHVEHYEAKMADHMKMVDVLDNQIPLFQQLHKQRGVVEKIEKQKIKMEEGKESTRILDGSRESELKAEISALKLAVSQHDTNLQAQRSKTEQCGARQQQVRTEIDVLHKRNAAQMTRLKRQSKEARNRNKHWHEQATQLESAIRQLQAQN